MDSRILGVDAEQLLNDWVLQDLVGDPVNRIGYIRGLLEATAFESLHAGLDAVSRLQDAKRACGRELKPPTMCVHAY